jgi:hypothetical protein
MLKRTIAISLLLLLSIGIILPFADSTAHGVRQSYQIGPRNRHHYRTRAWWRRYRARLRRKREAALEMAKRNQLLNLPANLNLGNFVAVAPQPAPVAIVAKNVAPIAAAKITAPTVTAPKVTAPIVTAPIVTAPTVTAPTVTAPAFTAPTVTAPRVIAPRITAPAVLAPAVPVVAVTDNPALPKNGPAALPNYSLSAHRVTTLKAPPIMSARLKAAPTATVVTSINSAPVLTNAPVVVNTPAAPKVAAEARPMNETLLRPKNPVSPLPGELSISVVALSRPNPAFLTAREEAKLLAGVNVSDLRRIVIDRMVTAGGWVTNDYVREINGGRVFVVTARTPRNGQTPEKAWTFYFTESGGRIYSLTTDSPVEHTERMGKEAERFIGTLHTSSQEEKE